MQKLMIANNQKCFKIVLNTCQIVSLTKGKEWQNMQKIEKLDGMPTYSPEDKTTLK